MVKITKKILDAMVKVTNVNLEKSNKEIVLSKPYERINIVIQEKGTKGIAGDNIAQGLSNKEAYWNLQSFNKGLTECSKKKN